MIPIAPPPGEQAFATMSLSGTRHSQTMTLGINKWLVMIKANELLLCF